MPTSTGVSRKFWNPNVDLCEDEDSIQLVIELAGFGPDQVNVHYSPEKHALAIRGRRMPDEGGKTKRCHQLEIWYGEFQRFVPLPDVGIDRDNIRARYVDGMLIVSVPKQEKIIKKTRIQVTEE